jgi:hypothetical protein
VQDRLDTKRIPIAMQSKRAPVSLVFGAVDLFGFYSQLIPASGSTRWRIAPRQIRTTSSLKPGSAPTTARQCEQFCSDVIPPAGLYLWKIV